MVLVVLGMLNVGWRTVQPSAGGVAPQAPETPALALGRTAVEGADCLRCHGVERHYVGRTLMPRHPHLTAEQAPHMARWMRSLPPATENTTPS